MPFATNAPYWYAEFAQSNSTDNPTAGQIYFTPVLLYHTVGLSGMSAVNNGNAGGTGNALYMGIYADAGRCPGTLIATTGAVTIGQTNSYCTGRFSAVTLAPGLYWQAFLLVSSSTSTTFTFQVNAPSASPLGTQWLWGPAGGASSDPTFAPGNTSIVRTTNATSSTSLPATLASSDVGPGNEAGSNGYWTAFLLQQTS